MLARVRCAFALFPIPQGVQGQAEAGGKPGLRQAKPGPDSFHVHRLRDMHDAAAFRHSALGYGDGEA
jgi:hypothetical protein